MSTDYQTNESKSLLRRVLDSDIWYSFKKSKVTMVAAGVALIIFLAALLAPLLAPHNPFDLASLSLMDSLLPPSWTGMGNPRYLLGTDDQGRDVLSTILYGSRISIAVGLASVTFAAGGVLTSIGDNAFDGCSSLGGALELPASLETIGNNVFRGTAVGSVHGRGCIKIW